MTSSICRRFVDKGTRTISIQRSCDPQAFHNFELDGWQSNTAGYEKHFARLTLQMVPATLNAASVVQGCRTLDVCTGPGMLVDAAQSLGAEAVELDFSSEAIDLAKRNVPKATFRQGDAQALPFDDGSFDAVVCGYGVIHLPDPDKALAEMYRVLRADGRVADSVWAPPTSTNGFGIIYSALKAHGDLAVPLPHGPDYFQFSDERSMTSALTQIGFRDITVEHVEQHWRLAKASDMIAALIEGTVRAGAIFRAQTEGTQAPRTNFLEDFGMIHHDLTPRMGSICPA